MLRLGPVLHQLVHCRIGSLERRQRDHHAEPRVHCRIGSLEIYFYLDVVTGSVHCRIGSLENTVPGIHPPQPVHCRIGSLEIHFVYFIHTSYRSLPHRQFRNHLLRCLPGLWGSLPYKHSFVICSIRTRGGEISADCHIFFKNSFAMCHILSSLNDIINENISI